MLKQQLNSRNRAALYLRLSRDDGGDVESNSIGNQRAILERYATESDFDIIGEYVDDGISGTTFERPNFKRMIEDIEGGKITIVLCKDLSRLGRNNAMVAYFTEIFFVQNRVRFIALNDGIDSALGDNEIMPFKSVINEYYARDISKKIRSAYKIQAQKGNYTGVIPPYDYLKNPENKCHLIPNPDTAPYVKRMFTMAASGVGTSQIARSLKDDGVLNPTAYSEQVLGVKRPYTYKNDTDWSKTSIYEILHNKVYLGHMFSQKTTTVSFKNKTPIRNSEEEFIVVYNTHEPLVEQDEFELAQKIFSIKKRGNRHGFDNIFVGVLKCSDCGAGLAIAFPTSHKNWFSYTCNRYRQYSNYCTTHYIRYDNIYSIVLEGIQTRQKFVREHKESELVAYAQQLADKGADIKLKQYRSELERFQKRCGELDHLLQKLFEQLALGAIPQERFHTLSATYELEQKALKEKVEILKKEVSKSDNNMQDILRFFDLARKHDYVTELTSEVVHKFVDHVVIYQAEGVGKSKTQKIVINFRFIKDSWFE